MTSSFFFDFSSVYAQLTSFANLSNFWSLFDTAFGSGYDSAKATTFQSQWQSGNFSQFPQIEIVISDVLGTANGAYASSTNKIYLSEQFLATASQQSLVNVVLEEFGHFVDAQINTSDSAGDEGAIFAKLVQGESLDVGTLQALKAEDDHGTITVNGQIIQVEQQNFTGTNGNDVITGTIGNDTIRPFRGQDVVNGGAGIDVLILDYTLNSGSYGLSSSIASNGSGGFDGRYQAGGQYSPPFDTIDFSNIEQFQITGTSRADSIVTGDGNDTINGGAGDDVITPNAGNNIVDGGIGTDTIIYDFSSSTSNLTLNPSQAISIAPSGSSYTNIEAFNLKTGSGNDTIKLQGRYNDTLTLGTGNDTVNSGLGQDVVDGGAGIDILILDYTLNNSSGLSSSIASNGSGGFDGNYQAGGQYSPPFDTVNFSNIEQFQITGTSRADSIVTGDGNDTINGGAGDDVITPNAGNNMVDGGNGTDTIIYDFSSSTSNLTLNTSQAISIAPSGSSYINIEAFDLKTGSGNDTIKLQGRYNDSLSLGTGNDTVNAGLGQDVVDGGAGIDILILDYTLNNSSGLSSSIASNGSGGFDGNYQAGGQYSPPFDTIDFSNIEQFQITGTSRADSIVTGDGNDTINGGAGNDAINGGAGNDLLTGVNPTSANPGIGEQDIVTGGAGGDRFILGDFTWSGYDDGLTNNAGTNDYADIADFNPTQGDIIQLKGGISYLLNTVGTDTQLLIDKPNTEPDELIGIIRNRTGLSLTGNYFAYNNSNTTFPTLSINNITVVEGNTTNAYLTVSLSSPVSQAITVNYTTTAIDATANADYTSKTGTLTIAPNSSFATLSIPILNDSLNEADEAFLVTLSSPGNAVLDPNATIGEVIISDTLQSSISRTLPTNVENLKLNGVAAINGTGNAGNNILTGNSGNNILNGVAGVDTLIGGLGNDTYIVDNAGDLVTETSTLATEIDTVQSSITYTLGTNLENLTLTGTTAINGTGNALNNIILGNGANNILTGSTGKDTLTGGSGSDRFGYKILTDSLLANFDVIKDFNANANNDLFLVTTARSSFTNAGAVATLDNAGIIAKLTTANFGANSAARFTFGTRSFVAINDATTGFSQTTDAIIEVTGLTGTLGLTNFVTV